ncbi:MAG: histidine phosphatase family protein, partial [Acidimicrobiales bacterium]
APPGGEERVDFYARVAAATEDLLAAEAGGRPMVVVSHGGVIRAMASINGGNLGAVGHLDGWVVTSGPLQERLTMIGPVRLLARAGRTSPPR